jgi:hypothetical protein
MNRKLLPSCFLLSPSLTLPAQEAPVSTDRVFQHHRDPKVRVVE